LPIPVSAAGVNRVSRHVEVRNASRGCRLAERAEVARGPLRRALGLIGRRDWSPADGLVIEPCNGVHTFFMRLTIDVVHVAADGRVLRAVSGLRPWRVGPVVFGSRRVLELPAGTVGRTGTRTGDRIEFAHTPAG
jgi:uncharacterized membrane protein (UPF0127 family)